MKLLAVTFALAAACASTKPAVTSAAPARDCGKMVPAVAERGSTVHTGPDGNAAEIATLQGSTPVCVSNDTLGFGFRRVKLSDGRTGFISEGSLSIE
jgi:hypothetical protein